MKNLPYDISRCAGGKFSVCSSCRRREPGHDFYQVFIAPAVGVNGCQNYIAAATATVIPRENDVSADAACATEDTFAEYLRARILYNPETGIFVWGGVCLGDLNHSHHKRILGEKAGSIGGDGYVWIGINGKIYAAHKHNGKLRGINHDHHRHPNS